MRHSGVRYAVGRGAASRGCVALRDRIRNRRTAGPHAAAGVRPREERQLRFPAAPGSYAGDDGCEDRILGRFGWVVVPSLCAVLVGGCGIAVLGGPYRRL